MQKLLIFFILFLYYNELMNKEIKIIAVPTKYGCYVDGADKAYDALKDILPYETSIINTIYENDSIYNKERLKYVYPVMDIAQVQRCEVLNNMDEAFPLIIGGDHSSCIGSISAALDKCNGDLSLIYIDAHADIHNDITTPSGNLHGLPLSILIGRCEDERLKIGINKLNPKNIFFVGLRSFEKEEMDFIKESGICYYTDEEANKRGLKNILKEVKEKIKTKHVHVSLDLDVMSNEEFYAVNINVNKTYSKEGGITFENLLSSIDYIKNNINPVSMDIVEYNPLLDEDKSCKEKINKIIKQLN